MNDEDALRPRWPRPALAEAYDLAPHPEGGWYRRTWTAGHDLELVGADGARRVRPAATLIQFCLLPGENSRWHVLRSDEVWIWNGGGTIGLQLGGVGQRPAPGVVTVLGPDPGQGQALQALVPAGTWQRALSEPTVRMASCLVSPGFDFADLRIAEGD